jgi:hypothetical protein
MSFFLDHFRHRQIAELLAHANELVDHGFKLAEGLNLLAIERHHFRVGQAHGEGFAPVFAGEQGIGAAFDHGAVGVLDAQELFGEGASAQLAQIGQLFQEGLASVFQVWVIGRGRFHIVVIILQYSGQKQGKMPKPSFISSTLLISEVDRSGWQRHSRLDSHTRVRKDALGLPGWPNRVVRAEVHLRD